MDSDCWCSMRQNKHNTQAEHVWWLGNPPLTICDIWVSNPDIECPTLTIWYLSVQPWVYMTYECPTLIMNNIWVSNLTMYDIWVANPDYLWYMSIQPWLYMTYECPTQTIYECPSCECPTLTMYDIWVSNPDIECPTLTIWYTYSEKWKPHEMYILNVIVRVYCEILEHPMYPVVSSSILYLVFTMFTEGIWYFSVAWKETFKIVLVQQNHALKHDAYVAMWGGLTFAWTYKSDFEQC